MGGQTTGGAYLSCLAEDTDLGLELLADILMRPQFAAEKIDLAKSEQKAVISRRNDEPMQIAMTWAPKVLFGEDHPYGQPLTGSGTVIRKRAPVEPARTGLNWRRSLTRVTGSLRFEKKRRTALRPGPGTAHS